MDYELLNVAWVTAAVVTAAGVTITALALTCKALQRCYIEYRRQRSRQRRSQQLTGGSATFAASASVSATAASGAAQHGNDSFDTFLQLSFNNQQSAAATAPTNGPQLTASRSPRGRSVAVQRSPVDPGGRHTEHSAVTAAFAKQSQHALDSGRPMTFEIRSTEESDGDSQVEEEKNSCEDARLRQAPTSSRPQSEAARSGGRAASGQSANVRTSGSSAGFYDPGGYDMEWPPTSSGRQASGDSWHAARQQQQQQQQQQGRRGHIFFGRGASHGSGRHAGNL